MLRMSFQCMILFPFEFQVLIIYFSKAYHENILRHFC